MRNKPEISIIVPVYNEENRVEKGIKGILDYLSLNKFSWELIIVDDGSTDRTVNIVNKLIGKLTNAYLLKSKHLGKGGAIKSGVAKANGSWLVFLDVDLATPMSELEKFLPFKKNYQVIIGSRKMKGADVQIHQPKFREFSGKIFTFLTNILVTKDISDITCGFKMYKSDLAKIIFKQSILTDWSFDAEILFLAQKQKAKIKEVPVVWRDDPRTKVNLGKDAADAFLGLLKIRANNILGKYKA